MEADTSTGVGNNLTLKLELFEHLGGHYIPTGVVGSYKLCDFLYNEPFFGKMYAKQFPGNWTCPFPPAMQIVPERHEIEYFNRKYLRNASITFRKLSRNSPHFVNLEVDSSMGVGNNFTGEYHFMNLTIHLENFPYNIPFTYSSMIVRTRADVQGFFTTTNEEVIRWKTYVKITQKMKGGNKKTKPLIRSFSKAIIATEIYPERVVTESGNSCLHTINFTFRKRSRTSPYYINFDFNATCGYGNNLTIKWKLSEYISGHYVPMPILFEYRLCDFLNKDPYLGQMYAKQLRGNWSCPFPPTTEIYPEKLDTIIKSTKYIHNITYTFRRHSRNSPYYIDFDYVATTGYGNNLTLKWQLNEYISGHYVPVPVQFEYKLCDFLYKDPFFGQMYAKQLVGNWSCPFPPGRSPFRNLVMHIENMPRIPFTYSSLIVRTRADLVIFMEEEIALVKIYLTVKWQLSEYISGRYVLVPVQFEYKLCDFLYKDPYLGQMFAKQLVGNWSCPFPAGRSPFRSLVMHLENMPRIPFTYSSLIVRTQCITTLSLKEEIAILKIYMTTTEIYPEKLETITKSSKHVHNITFTFRRHSRNSPYFIDFDYVATSGYGNNVTGRSPFRKMEMNLENLPPIPFTYSSLIVRIRADVNISMGSPLEEVASVKIYLTIKQTLNKFNTNIWKG
ncbi:hypothetical protein PYW08_004363 [Mythimna loreyi]|uniref:Uncharacterized protein n=1 Tax=Mythimna loreyi TaxID=667449 RepID=A0ACC2QP90_9NEOP|nr:hypothetical protein PYW08_004363 [Mythimna loreyi]